MDGKNLEQAQVPTSGNPSNEAGCILERGPVPTSVRQA